jgi:hypothetical protein
MEGGREGGLGEGQRRRLAKVVRGTEEDSPTVTCLVGWREGPMGGREGGRDGGRGGTVSALVAALAEWAANVKEGRVTCVWREKEEEAWRRVVEDEGGASVEGKWWGSRDE